VQQALLLFADRIEVSKEIASLADFAELALGQQAQDLLPGEGR
jgi:hypothetical protein